jgi:hypothetical protein
MLGLDRDCVRVRGFDFFFSFLLLLFSSPVTFLLPPRLLPILLEPPLSHRFFRLQPRTSGVIRRHQAVLVMPV